MTMLITLLACQIVLAQLLPNPGIALYRTPAPPNKVLNDGSHSIDFYWNINYLTNCASPYTFAITGPLPATTTVLSQNYSCAASEIQNSLNWNPVGQTPGCYYATLTFFSDWCNGDTSIFEDKAQVAFQVAPAGTFKICKFQDLNGNGVKDPDDPPLAGWQFTVEKPVGTVVAMGTTSADGCTPDITLPVDTGGTTYYIREVLQTGWQKTTQSGANPFPVVIQMGPNANIYVGNWQPIIISGYKWLDKAPWPWTDPEYVGPEGQENPAEYEPVPPCPQPTPPAACSSPTQPDPQGIGGVTISLYASDGTTLLATKLTASDGSFSFGPLQWAQNFVIKETTPSPQAPSCDTDPEDGGLTPWPGDFVGTVATSPWPCRIVNFANPNELDVTLPTPVVANQEYGCNYFYNRQPSRLWGQFCASTMQLLPSVSLGIGKDGDPYPVPSVSPAGDGTYVIPELAEDPEGLRPGVYELTPPSAPSSSVYWEVTTYCNGGSGKSTFPLSDSGYVDVTVPSGTDVRVDFCLVSRTTNKMCYLPVTFTQDGWHNYCDPNNTVIPGGMVYNKFKNAFANFIFYGTTYNNKMLVGKTKTITYDSTTASLTRLCMFLPQTGACGKLDQSYNSPWSSTSAGALAGEAIALTMNIAYNDQRLMPRTPGYDLEKFVLAKGLMKGKTVCQVLDIANKVLSGDPTCQYGIPTCSDLVDILHQINANYEFVDMNTFTDNGYLIPNRAFGPPDAPVTPHVPCT